MQVLHIVDSMDPAMGGPPVSVSALAAAQAAAGHDVTIAWRRRPGVTVNPAASFAHVPGIGSVKWHPFDFSLRSYVAGAPIVAPLFDERASRIVVHGHGVWRPEFLRIASESRRRGIPYLIAPRGMLGPWSLSQKRLKKRIAWTLFWKKTLDGAAAIHALNEDEAQHVRDLGITAPIEIIPNGVYLEQVQAVVTPYALPAGRSYVLFIGRLHLMKGLDILAEAFARVAPALPDLDLVVAGPDDGDEARFRGMTRDLGIESRVHMVGPIYGKAKYELMAGAKCLCAPSRQEGFSMSIVEALGMGLPVVISRECHLPEVGPAGAGRVVELQVEAVADGLLGLLRNSQQLQGAGAAARALVTQRFQWPAIAQQTLRIYERLPARVAPAT